ncbi:hypothetical protein BJ994_002313 [Arthrobacter pigmenti]|uniref:RiboL-PSP-HEPN domain-containing protein n=1 Tax=Arthrobacter pigmenti TaxID=271432 RepID=A0A846RSS7_9MICC|nr:HEPN domain-containing protein [Arthrobacter pigmenti]NJC23237.1 hypothetical protein [Arthrobacter pigmenti]
MKDVQNLDELHPAPKGTPGRPLGDTGPLLRSMVVLLHTAWENYVEQVALEGLEFLLREIGEDHSKLPHALRQKVATAKNPWDLAGSAWKTKAREVVLREADTLNTPNVEKTEKLLELALGLSNGLHQISWQKMSEVNVVANVDEFVQDIRGEIVHKGTTPGTLNKAGVASWTSFFRNLTKRLDKEIAAHLQERVGKSPW